MKTACKGKDKRQPHKPGSKLKKQAIRQERKAAMQAKGKV